MAFVGLLSSEVQLADYVTIDDGVAQCCACVASFLVSRLEHCFCFSRLYCLKLISKTLHLATLFRCETTIRAKQRDVRALVLKNIVYSQELYCTYNNSYLSIGVKYKGHRRTRDLVSLQSYVHLQSER